MAIIQVRKLGVLKIRNLVLAFSFFVVGCGGNKPETKKLDPLPPDDSRVSARLQRASAEQASSLAYLDEALGKWNEARLELLAAKKSHDPATVVKKVTYFIEQHESCLAYLKAVEESHEKVWRELTESSDFVYGREGGRAEREAIKAFRDKFTADQKRLVGLEKFLISIYQDLNSP